MKHKKNGPAGPAHGTTTQTSSAAPHIAAEDRPTEPRFRKILVPIDFSDASICALDYALSLAACYHANLVLLHVVEPLVSSDQRTRALPSSSDITVEHGRERLEALRNRRPTQLNRAEMLVRIGHAPSEITDTANALGADLIVLGTDRGEGASSFLLGSTAEKVVRHSGCAVLTVRNPGPS